MEMQTDQYANPSGGSGYGSSEQSESGKSPLSMSLGFLKTLTEKKSTRVDGQPSKRRGPKPDSKPALTRRQELNRQAQRTHRERKELYIKALEQEVLRLKQNFSSVARSKDTLAEENRQLRNLLAAHGIPWTGSGGVDELAATGGSTSYPSSGSFSGSYPSSVSPTPQYSTNAGNNGAHLAPPLPQTPHTHHPSAAQGLDLDQAGIDFVLTLERPCMDHLQFLVELSSTPSGMPCGHALMATCPPVPHPADEMPWGHGVARLPHEELKTWDLQKGDLANLLDLSMRLNLDGEITPVMAWGMVLGHPRFRELGTREFGMVVEELTPKVRCYGFGAVLEEFEVRDAMENMFSTL
ncbi:hypothetical protein VE01_10020 [Pseudogymnoascus verrucosus]|uniref:BZIP domain-containing protein n=1 Tax=Pseudogymnoascus verrucosus TaxID=342668 RepID=A0A1B8G8M1_9PEZI|nr:uncharacterized protein VE01_10020 [Pseudogymnoascus verrucosus]OBT92183.2 hypothetical protein VE01_10020 [Pseudogymnoascus verrucosus]